MTDPNSKPSLIEENVGDENPTNDNLRINKPKQKRAANQIKRRRDAGDLNVGLTEASAETVGDGEREAPAGDETEVVAGGAREAPAGNGETVTAGNGETVTAGNGETVTAAGGAREAPAGDETEVVAGGAREIVPVVPNIDALLLQNFANNALANIPRFILLGHNTLWPINTAVVSRNAPDIFGHYSTNGSIETFVRTAEHINRVQDVQRHNRQLANENRQLHDEMQALQEQLRIAREQAQRADLFRNSGLGAIDST